MEPIAYIEFAGGAMRPVYEENGKQFVIDDDGNVVFGVWFIPRDAADVPMVVPAAGECLEDDVPF